MNAPTYKLFVILSLPFVSFLSHAQVLHTETFNVILDTSKVIKGNFIPSIRYRNVKENFIEIENTSDISIRMSNNGITVANKLEYARYGDEDIMSGGFVYLEYKRLSDTNNWALEPYLLMLWQEIRGLDMKYAGGVNLRGRLYQQQGMGFFAGAGVFYESERWNYAGTSDSTLIPADPRPVEVENIRGMLYVNFKKEFATRFDLDVSAYYQPKLTSPENFRLATSSQITFNFTEHIGITTMYQNIYDPEPIVPIDELFNDVTLGLTLSF